jgi:hypothetical protein
MGSWNVDTTARPGVLSMTLAGAFTVAEMEEVRRAHNAAIDAFGGGDYRVFVDLSDLAPFSPECAEIMEACKLYSSSRPNFQGSAVLASSKIVALQHQRTSVAGGVIGTELISEDLAACEAHLARVHRPPPR